MGDRQIVYVPVGTIAFSMPIIRDGKLTGAELIWLKPIYGINRPWVGRSEWYAVDIVHEVTEPTKPSRTKPTRKQVEALIRTMMRAGLL